MFGGTCYMLNDKNVHRRGSDELMCRIGPDGYDAALERPGCREMVFTGKPMNGYVFVNEEGMKRKKDFDHWIDLCLALTCMPNLLRKRKNNQVKKSIL